MSVLAATVALVALPALPAAAESQRMTLDCGGTVGVIERTNGSSWWGVEDGTVYTTKYLRIVGDGWEYEKSYGHVGRPSLLCEADHVTPDHSSHWTVELVPGG